MTFIAQGRGSKAGRVLRSGLFAAFLLCAIAPQALGQTVQSDLLYSKGFHSERSYFSAEPWEHFDPVTGNLILTFTDLILPGNGGRSLQFQRVFNNQRVNYEGMPNVSRWTFGFPGMVMRIRKKAPVPANYTFGSLESMLQTTPEFFTADGGRRRTIYTANPIASDPESLRWVQSGQFYRYDQFSGPGITTLYMPDGTVCHYDINGFLNDFTDPFNNTVTLVRTAQSLVVTQSLGNGESRQVTFTLDADGLPTEMEFQGRRWRYVYQAGTPRDIERVDPPAGRSWSFGYDTADLTTVTTPNGGQVAYTYVDKIVYPNPLDTTVSDSIHVLRFRDTSGRDVEAGHWTIDVGIPPYGTVANETDILTPSGRLVAYLHGATAPHGMKLEGGFGLTERQITVAGFTPLFEKVKFVYENLPIAHHSPSASVYTQDIKKREIFRYDGAMTRTYTTDYAYRPSTIYTPNDFGDYHHPSTITESVDGAEVRKTEYTYQAPSETYFVVGNPLSETVTVSGQSFVKSWTYLPTGFRTSETIAGITTTYAPDNLGNVQKVTKANDKWTSFLYSYGQARQITTPEYFVSREINNDGTTKSETRAGRKTTYTYDHVRRVTVVEPPGTSPITTTYDLEDGKRVRTTRGQSVTTTTLDGFGRSVETANSLGNRTATRYDAEGRKTFEGYPVGPTGELLVGTTIEYDHLDRVTKETNPDQTFRLRTYTQNGVIVKDENGRETTYTNSSFGHPDDTRLTGVLDADGKQWSYSFDVVGALTGVSGPGGVSRTWVYGDKHLLSQETHPESGTVHYTNYDLAGVLKEKRDERGTVFKYAYDGNDRVRTVTAGSRLTQIDYEDGSDNRIFASVGPIATTFRYDNITGRLEYRTDVVNGKSFSTRYKYDANDNLEEITYPSGRHVKYEFDTEGRITRVFRLSPAQNYATVTRYHPSGAIEMYTAGNNVVTTITIDPQRYWISSIQADQLGLTYDYDDVGNVESIVDSRPGMNQLFEYDNLDRLKKVSVSGITTATYTYDPHGNRQGGGEVYTANPFQLASLNGQTVGYDLNGNLTTAPGLTYAYTPDNLLELATASGTTSTFTYDGDGWRVKRVVGGLTTYYVRGPNGELLSEWSVEGSTATVRDYIYAGSRLLTVAVSQTTAP